MTDAPTGRAGNDPPARPRDATPPWELVVYVGAAVSYIGVAFFRKEIFAWWWFGAIWFVLFVWFVPKLFDRIRGIESDDRPSLVEPPDDPEPADVPTRGDR